MNAVLFFLTATLLVSAGHIAESDRWTTKAGPLLYLKRHRRAAVTVCLALAMAAVLKMIWAKATGTL